MVRKRKAADALMLASANAPQPIPVGVKLDFVRLMPGRRHRHDGWTNERLQRFVDTLAYTGCVRDAARVAGVSDTSIYKLKKRFPLFAAVWEDALSRAGQGLIAIAYRRAVEGRETVVYRNGEEYERRITPSDTILGLLLKRGDTSGHMLVGGKTPEEILTLDEWRRHVRFAEDGRKYAIEDPAVSHRKFVEKMSLIRTRLEAHAAARHECPSCGQTLPADWPRGSMAELVAGGLVDARELDED
jgi:hypothetical protein